ncbi:hypothetical protein DBV15_00019 [Temnothorax longispinosus]|uniref:Uncharacterized protein n=1 Tax=Temnothorax longispinosus TaxID=300112 RepID=A0A4S2KET5_9HYME|nr:hypothetical protein DBV15_00019 [Temnothorax longispinosus]
MEIDLVAMFIGASSSRCRLYRVIAFSLSRSRRYINFAEASKKVHVYQNNMILFTFLRFKIILELEITKLREIKGLTIEQIIVRNITLKKGTLRTNIRICVRWTDDIANKRNIEGTLTYILPQPFDIRIFPFDFSFFNTSEYSNYLVHLYLPIVIIAKKILEKLQYFENQISHTFIFGFFINKNIKYSTYLKIIIPFPRLSFFNIVYKLRNIIAIHSDRSLVRVKINYVGVTEYKSSTNLTRILILQVLFVFDKIDSISKSSPFN